MQGDRKPIPIIRLLHQKDDGTIVDQQDEFNLAQFAGTLPSIGDIIVHPVVEVAKIRSEPANRTVLTVVGRVFNPKDMEGFIGLIVTARFGSEKDSAFL